MSDQLARRLLLDPGKDFQSAVDVALKDLAPLEHVAVMPHAASTVPYLETVTADGEDRST